MLAIMMAMLVQAAAPAGPAIPAAGVRPSIVTNPDWVRRPSGEDIARYYPDAAMRQNLPGRATISCQVLAAGTLSDCRVVEESPADVGFGAAAMKLGALFKMRPQTKDGVPVDGGTVRIPLRFQIGGQIDPLTAMVACYGQTAALAQKDPGNAEAMGAYTFYAAQVAMREAQAKATPESFEMALMGARRSAAANPNASLGPDLKACLDVARRQPTPPAP